MRPHCSKLLSVIATDFPCHLRSQEETMAELILRDIVDAISHQLDSLISMGTGPALLGVTVGGRLEELQRTLHGISHVLGSIESFELGTHPVFREWLDELTCVINDVEDLVDDFHTEALQQRGMQGSRFLKEVRIFFSSSNPLFYRRNMAHRLEGVQRRLDGIQQCRINFNLLKSDGLTVLLERRRGSSTGSFCPEPSCMIGRDWDKSRILESLLHQNLDANAAVLPIGGVRGVGKTTLAQAVFLDKRVKEYFELRLWVSVPADCDLETLMLEMLVQCPSESVPAMDEAEGWLGQCLHGKRVLLVLDDVREDDQSKWSKLQQLVNGAADGSKILVTTCSLNAAKAANTSFVCQLSGLSEDESLTLLMREAGKTKNDEEWYEDISREIVGKCAGLPLAIKSVGRTPLSDWSSFIDRDLSELVEDDHHTMTTLQSNYSSLQPVLKRCFAYFSLFPKDYTFDSLELINLWISQGYIEWLEDGHDHLMELASKSFLTEKERDVFGNIVVCKMNRLVHDLAKHVAGHQWIMLDRSNRDRVPESCLHLSTHLLAFHLGEVGDMHRLRTFLLVDTYKPWRCSVDWDECMSRFKKLRALRLWRVPNLRNIPKSVGRLRHLRHLDLSNNEDLEALPTSISKLHNLITLDLNGCGRLRELPSGISKLAGMRHLYTRGCDNLSHMPKGVEKLTCLQTLCQFVVGKKRQANAATLIELRGLIRLKDLAIRHLEREVLPESVASCLQNSSDLRSLELEWEDASGGIDRANHAAVLESLQPRKSLKQFIVRGYGGDRLAAWCSQLDNLIQLEIRDCLHCKHLPSLHHLPNLKSISLENMRELEYVELSGIDESSYSLPTLRRIVLKNLPEFKGWEKRRGNEDEFDTHEDWDPMILSIHDSEKLEIHGCPKLSCLRPGFLSLWGLTDKILQKLVMRSDREGNGLGERILRPQNAITSILSVSLNELKSIEISNLVNVEYLPEELLKSLPALDSLVIKRCVCLKALNGWTVLRYLSALTKLEISMCPRLDLSAEHGDEDRHNLQQQGGQRKLTHLSLHNIPKMENLPGWIQFLPNLTKLSIRHCNALKALPQFMNSLTSLRTLRIYFCEGLESLPGRVMLQLSVTSPASLEITGSRWLDFSEEEDREFSGPSKLLKLEIRGCEKMPSFPWLIQFLPNLEELSIRHCNGLKALPQSMNSLTSLRTLGIYYCEGLESLPGRAILQLSVSSLESLEIGWCPQLDFSEEEDREFSGPSKLRKLEIRRCGEMRSLPWWIQFLPNLEELWIRHCNALKALPQFMSSLTSLRTLRIHFCEGLESLPGRAILRLSISSLESLEIRECWRLDFSEEEDREFCGPSELRKLEIRGSGNMRSLPWWIQRLTSLEILKISHCESLEALPEWFPQLTSLKELRLFGPWHLSWRCRRGTGEDWPKISHIQSIWLYGERL